MEEQTKKEFLLKSGKRRRSSVLGYEQSLMFGQYREQLASFARTQAQKATTLQDERRKVDTPRPTNVGLGERFKLVYRLLTKHGGDWIILAILGICMALISFLMDLVIHACFNLRSWLMNDITDTFIYQYALWVLFTVSLIMIAAIVVRLISPQAAGSGVSEMKVILRGVVLKEYLSFKTLVTKAMTLPIVLGSGLPLGKEGPCVHISAMVANQLIKLFGHITSLQEYESRFLEVMAVACAVGVAATFAAPVGGVLYSIEIVSVFFSVRSYWQGFFAATWGALLWRLLSVWFHLEESITVVFNTDFRSEFPYESLELFAFLLLGIICGLASFCFVTLQRKIVLFSRRKSKFHLFIQKQPLMYPLIVTTIIGLISFPPAFGQYYASWLSSEQSMHELFSNITWGSIEFDDDHPIVDNWRTSTTSIYTNTFLFFIANLVIVALASTMPVPLGLIVPSFKIGAGFGRFYGEGMAYLFPDGMNPYGMNRTEYPLLPGAYSVAGSAAFAGGTTGALSSAVIAFEMTGQLTHLLPIIIATIASNLVAQYLGPSIYDSLIKLKKLPYLPAIIQSSSAAHRIFVEDFMRKDLFYVWQGCSYRYLRHLLNTNKHIHTYPFVNSPDLMILLGSVDRLELEALLDDFLRRDNFDNQVTRKVPPQLPATQSTTSPCPVHGGEKARTTVDVTIPEEDEVEDIVVATPLRHHVWEEERLDHMVDFSQCPIDPAPLQLVQGTSLMKTHTLFSLLGLQVSYVTSLGRLIGVVALKELRKAIDAMNSGTLPLRRSSVLSAETQPMKEP